MIKYKKRYQVKNSFIAVAYSLKRLFKKKKLFKYSSSTKKIIYISSHSLKTFKWWRLLKLVLVLLQSWKIKQNSQPFVSIDF